MSILCVKEYLEVMIVTKVNEIELNDFILSQIWQWHLLKKNVSSL